MAFSEQNFTLLAQNVNDIDGQINDEGGIAAVVNGLDTEINAENGISEKVTSLDEEINAPGGLAETMSDVAQVTIGDWTETTTATSVASDAKIGVTVGDEWNEIYIKIYAPQATDTSATGLSFRHAPSKSGTAVTVSNAAGSINTSNAINVSYYLKRLNGTTTYVMCNQGSQHASRISSNQAGVVEIPTANKYFDITVNAVTSLPVGTTMTAWYR